MNEILQLMNGGVMDGFIAIIALWGAWLAAQAIRRRANGAPDEIDEKPFNDRPFDDRPFDGDR